MTRSALVIKMLQYLRANDLVKREDLAKYLETNIRNVAEFKKELEIAGYVIETVRGHYGGYRLIRDNLMPSLTLNDKETKALNDADLYLSKTNFHALSNFQEALHKIRSNINNPTMSHQIHYLYTPTIEASHMENLFMQAKETRSGIHFKYRSLHSDTFEERYVHPYELIYSEDGNYVLAYDLSKNKEKHFKIFKISLYRMIDVKLSNHKFTRDKDFDINDYIGKQNIIGEVHSVELKVSGMYATLLQEKSIGIMAEKQRIGEFLYITFKMENKNKMIEFILSLGKYCEVIKPLDLRKEIEVILQETLNQYML